MANAIIFGDSWHTPFRWPTILGVFPPGTGVFLNAIGGSTLTNVRNQVVNKNLQGIECIYISGGFNDLRVSPTAATLATMQQMVTQIKTHAAAAGTVVVIEEIAPFSAGLATLVRDQLRLQYNTWLGAQPGCVVINMDFLDANLDGVADAPLLADVFHMNANGYALLEAQLASDGVFNFKQGTGTNNMFNNPGPWAAGSLVTDIYGNVWVVQGAAGSFSSAVKPQTTTIDIVVDTDTFAEPRPATGTEVGTPDVFGVVIPAGGNVIEFPGGQVMCVPPKVTDTFAIPRPATTAEVGTTDVFGTVIPPGANVIQYPGGQLYCAPGKAANVVTAGTPTCHWDDNGLASGAQVDAYLDQNLEFDSAALAGVTNPCCNSVQGSTNSGASGCSGTHQSVSSSANGTRNVIDAGNNVQIPNGAFNHASGANNAIDGNIANQVAGVGNTVSGAGFSGFNQVAGNGNDVLDGSSNNTVAGAVNSLTELASGNTVAGNANVLVEADFNSVVGVTNRLLGPDVQNNDVSGNDNTLTDEAGSNDVTGNTNLLDGVSRANQVGGTNQVITDSSGNSVVGVGNILKEADFNVIGGGTNTVTGPETARNLIVGLNNLVADVAPVDSTTDNFVGGRVNELTGASASILQGWFNCIRTSSFSHISSSSRSGIDGVDAATILSSAGVANPTSFTVAGGVGAGTKVSANRMWELNSLTGNLTLAGTVNTGFTFPDFGEYAVVDKDIEEGLFVKFVGTHKAEIAEDGVFDGISRAELPMSAGGGIDPDNCFWQLDDMGNRVVGDYEVESVELAADAEATAAAQQARDDEAKKDHEARQAKADAVVDARNKAAVEASAAYNKKLREAAGAEGVPEDKILVADVEDYEPVPAAQRVRVSEVMVERSVTSTVTGPLPNPEYDAARAAAVKTVGVSMVGRRFAKISGTVAVGDYLTAGAGGRGVVSTERTAVRVLAVDGDSAFVVIR